MVLEGTNIQIVTEYMANGSLLEYLRSRGRTVITKESQINFARFVFSFMHLTLVWTSFKFAELVKDD